MHVYDSDEYYNFEFWLVNIFWTHFFDKFVHFHELGRADGGQIGFFPTEPVFSLFLSQNQILFVHSGGTKLFARPPTQLLYLRITHQVQFSHLIGHFKLGAIAFWKMTLDPTDEKSLFYQRNKSNRPEKNLERPKMIINWNCKNI